MATPAIPQIEKLFHEAAALPADQRSAYLHKTCAGDDTLRAAVQSLLDSDAADQSTDKLLISPVAQLADLLRAQDVMSAEVTEPTLIQELVFADIPGYKILSELGRGGMGVVYKVRQINLDRIVALKMLLPGEPPDSEMLTRFRIEIDTLARLQHPNIITIYDIGTFQGRPFFTMEYLNGPGLDRLLLGRQQDCAGAARIIEILARTMHIVHQAGIIHRDLKPSNILLRIIDSRAPIDKNKSAVFNVQAAIAKSAILKITDFGLAKDQAAASKLTQTGTAMGTPCYMAPEQAQARRGRIGPATDVYALGSILYEMLTGRPPFDGEWPADVIMQLLHDEPISPARLRPKLPRDIATICLKCLEKDPRRRYANAGDLAEDLRRFQAKEPVHARPVGWLGQSWRWCRRRPLSAGLLFLCGFLLAALLATVVIYEVWLAEALYTAEVKNKVQNDQIVDLNIAIGRAEEAQGDGFRALLRFVEAWRLDEDHPELEKAHRSRIAGILRGAPRLLHLRVENAQIWRTSLTADGGWLVTVEPGNVLRVKELATGRAMGPALALGDTPVGGTISQDGRTLAVITAGGTVQVWDVASGKSRPLSGQAKQMTQDVVIHPDNQVLLTRHTDRAIHLWNLAGNLQELAADFSGSSFAEVTLADNGRWLFTVDSTQMGQLWNVASGKARGQPIKLGEIAKVSISPTGRWVGLLGRNHILRLWDEASAQWLGAPIHGKETQSQVEFSPDDKHVIIFGGKHGFELREMSTGTKVLARAQTTVQRVYFEPTGLLLATMDDAGRWRIWNTQTGQQVTPPLRHAGVDGSAAFWAGGKQLALVGDNGVVTIWALPGADNGMPPALSAESRSLADIMTLAQVLAAGRIDDEQHGQPLDAEQLAASWLAFQSKH